MGRTPLSSHRFEEVDFASTSEETLRPVLDATNLLNREARPRSVDLALDDLRDSAPGMIRRRFVVTGPSGQLVGLTEGRYPDDDTSPELLLCMLRVLPRHRGKGAGRAMLEHLVELADSLGRSRLLGYYFDTVPAGKAFADAVGAVPDIHFHESVLRLSELDRELIEAWARVGPDLASDYSVRVFDGEIPTTWHDDIARLFVVLERDSPSADELEPREWSASLVKDTLDHILQRGDMISSLAIHNQTDTAVGISQLARRRSDPTTWQVTFTMVDPDHRGQSLGKCLKGSVNVAALEQWKGGVYQETGNAFTNEAMLAINRAMGFEHELTITQASLPLDQAKGYLSSRP
ncbi:MAG: GNAT family N-acetyltransferase [Acidimicrobiia bacterium]|jgi:GNAT superfamily N-acetyltransferase